MSVQNHFTFQNAAVATGNGNVLEVRGATLLAADATFAGTAVALFEGRIGADAGTWRTLLTRVRSTGFLASSFATSGHYLVDIAGMDQVRCRISSWTSGAVTVIGRVLNDSHAWVPEYSVGSGSSLSSPIAPPALVHFFSSTTGVPVTYTEGLPVGETLTSQTTLTRPNDTTAYTAGDAVTDSTSAPTAIVFANCARANGAGGHITGVTMLDSANQATDGQFELWLFSGTSAPTATNDNAAFTPTDANLANCIGVFSLTTAFAGDATAGAGGNLIYQSEQGSRPFRCGASTTSLWGLLVVRNAYTPVAQEVFTITLGISAD